MNTPPLTLSHVSLAYGTRHVLDDVSLALPASGITLLTGPNGGGKTSLLRAMAGLLRPAAGSIVRRPGLRTGYLPQQRRIDRRFPITVAQVVASGLLNRGTLLGHIGKEGRAAVERTLAELRLEALADRPIEALSGGQWQRTLLARAVVSSPGLLLLDEPDTHLDTPSRAFLYDRLAAWASTCSIVIVSHDAAAATALRPTATYVADGRRLSPAAARAL